MTGKLLKELIHHTPVLSLTVPLCYTRALKESTGKPMIIRQAEAFKRTLENLPIVIRPDELILGTFDEDIPVAIPRPEGSGLRIIPELEDLSRRSANPIRTRSKDIKVIREVILPFWEKSTIETYAKEIAPKNVFEVFYSGGAFVPTEVGGIAHTVIDYPRLLFTGLKRYYEMSKEKIGYQEKLVGSDPKADERIAFYKSINIVSSALIDYARTYANKAQEMAQRETDLSRKKELKKVAETCRHVPENSPRDLWEALQFIWFMHMALHIENFEHGISFGRMDQYLLPYYGGNSEESLKLFKNLFLKTNEIVALYDSLATVYFGGMATTQGLNIGGFDKQGKDATNELTYMILKAIEESRMPNPNLTIRCHPGTPHELYESIATLLGKGINVMGLMNDEVVVRSLVRYGIPLTEARDYGIVGCVGLSTSGSGFENTGAVFLNMAKALEVALGTDTSIVRKHMKLEGEPKAFRSVEDLLEAYRKSLKVLVWMSAVTANAYQHAHKKLKPTPVMSLCINGCFENGYDVNEGSARYSFSGIHVAGFSDVVDLLAAIDWAVFREKKLTLRELIDAVRTNFIGREELRQYLLHRCPKFGNDDDHADIYATRVGEILAESVKGLRSARGGEYRIGVHAMTTHVGFGLSTGALPSGRRRGEPLARDIGPTLGGEKGLTAAIKSVTKVDHSLLGNGLAFTVTINRDVARTQEGKVFEALIRTYFKLMGEHMQFNALSPSVLKDAQKSPEKYLSLIVRVSAYSARFVDLPELIQNEIIARYCYNEAWSNMQSSTNCLSKATRKRTYR